jgi:hypothetical protein
MLTRRRISAVARSALWCASVLLIAPEGASTVDAQTTAAGKATREVRVLDPVGVISASEAVVPPAPRLSALAGKKVWVIVVDNGSTLMPAVAALLPGYAPRVQIETISTSERGNPFFMLKAEDRPDAVIAGTGVCESTTVDAVSYAKQADKLGIPAVVSFLGRVLYAQQQAMDKLQFFGVRAFATDLPDPARSEDAERRARRLIPRLIEGLTRPVGADRPRISFEGPEPEARAYFESLEWTAGGPVVLPTEDRVAALLRGTSHRPAEVIGIMGGVREATVEKVAVNAALAGFSPDEMPLALALAAMMCRTRVAEELSQKEPPALQLAVGGPASATAGVVDSSRADTIGRLARLLLIHLGGLPGAIFEGRDPWVIAPRRAEGGEGTVALLDAKGAGVWKESTTAVDEWR